MRRMVMAKQGMRDLQAAGAEPLPRDPPDSDEFLGVGGSPSFEFCNMLWACRMYLE